MLFRHVLYSLSYQSKIEPSFSDSEQNLNMKFRNQVKGAASTGFIQMVHSLERDHYMCTHTLPHGKWRKR